MSFDFTYFVLDQVEVSKNTKEKPLRELHGARLYGYSAGILGQILPFSFCGALIMIYFVYTIGLSPILVSIGTSSGFIINAIACPLTGLIADRKKVDRLGKRRSLLLLGLPAYVFSFILLWYSPKADAPGSKDFNIAIQMWMFLLIFYFSYALIRSTYLSMLPEQSQTVHNRVQISKIQGIFSIIASVVAFLLPIVLLGTLEDPTAIFHTTPDGQRILKIVPWMAIGFAFLSGVLTIVTFYSVDEKFHFELESNTQIASTEYLTIQETVLQLLSPFKDLGYRRYLLSSFFWNVSLQIILKIMFFIFTYVLELESEDFFLAALYLTPFAGIGFILWSKTIKKQGLKKTYLISSTAAAIFLILGLLFLIPMVKIIRSAIAVFVLGGIIASIVPGFILPNPIISNFVDKQQLYLKQNENENQSGAYFGSFLFALSIAYAVGDFFTGLIFEGNTENPQIIVVFLPLASLMFIIAVLFVKKVKFEYSSNNTSNNSLVD
ncbi:hypothetical protein NEF87_001974 [Candidatus Lokiarchaeum ossiferum]|uniref:MFS transporter n=1 Tax=Candidatus Lokiarchaeum ossiferum TaxID=2951803 RepID=A0ABY6HT92_9ARCH|nr:hypothetical protein NEF87_001974 [Candidatus Lokiarchaeum sp. B-35]